MKSIRNLVAMFAVASTAVLLSACGDDDNESGNDSANQPNPPANEFAPSETEFFARDRSYVITQGGEQTTFVFASSGSYEWTKGPVPESGSVSEATRTPNSWSFRITPVAGQEGARSGTITMDFTAASSGAWMFAPENEQSETGTFDMVINGHGDPVVTPPIDSITGKTLQLFYAGGGSEKFEFVTDTNVSYENGVHSGTYTWDSLSRRLNMVVNNVWIYDISLPAGSNVATVRFNQNDGSDSTTDTPTYILQ